MLTVLIPAYNEQATLGELLRQVWAAPYEKQIVVVDDGSTDGTGEILAAWEARCEVIRLPANRGKGAAIRAGLARATGRFTIVQDADLEYDPQDYPKLIEPLLAGRADVVYGSRYLRPGSATRSISPFPPGEGSGVRTLPDERASPLPALSPQASASEGERQGVRQADVVEEAVHAADHAPRGLVGTADPTGQAVRIADPTGQPTWVNRAGVAGLNLAVWLLYGARLTDEATCYKAFPTEVLRAMDLQCERFEFCPEVTAKALRMGLRILEVPIRYDARTVAQGKKIRWRDGAEALKTLWRWRKWRPAPQATAATPAQQRRDYPAR